MLLLIFHAGGARYGLDSTGIVEVLPAAALRPVPRTAACVTGLLNYRGAIVPVLDLTALLTGGAAKLRLSSRIVIVDFRDAGGAGHPLGLLAERATETVQCRESDFQPPGIRSVEAPYSGDILVDRDGMVQKVEIRKLLPVELQADLFAAVAASV